MMIATYEGIKKLKISINKITQTINTKYVLTCDCLIASNCERARNINIAVIAKSNPNASGLVMYLPKIAPTTLANVQNKYAVIFNPCSQRSFIFSLYRCGVIATPNVSSNQRRHGYTIPKPISFITWC